MNFVMNYEFHRRREFLGQLGNSSFLVSLAPRSQVTRRRYQKCQCKMMMVHPAIELLIFSLADGLPASVLNLEFVYCYRQTAFIVTTRYCISIMQ